MKRILVLAGGLAATGGLAFGVVGERHAAGATGRDVPVMGKALTYEQALAAHYPAAENARKGIAIDKARGLPMCTNANQPGGYKDPAALQAAVAAAPEGPTCYADPHLALYGPPLSACDMTSFPGPEEAREISKRCH